MIHRVWFRFSEGELDLGLRGEDMRVKEVILKEIESVPEQYLVEVLDFIRFIGTKTSGEGIETAIGSESSLGKDWLIREENEAWRDL